ncbi:MAG TPA: NAD(P)H-binding protein [Mesorhizobium sp.]
MFFVSGITGKVGGAAATRLLNAGKPVRALVRDATQAAHWADRGVELREGSLTDGAALADALQGVDAAFLMQPTPFAVTPDFPEARAITAGIVSGLRQVQPSRLVILSSIGSERPGGLGNINQTQILEAALADYQRPVAIVRAGSFLENYIPSLDRARGTGVFDSFLQPTFRRFPMVASQDIGRVVAELLASEWSGRRVIELGTPTSPDDLAAAMARVLHREVVARAIPRDAWTPALASIGLPADSIGPWEEMQDGFNSGWIDFGAPGAEIVRGTVTPSAVFAGVAAGAPGRAGP